MCKQNKNKMNLRHLISQVIRNVAIMKLRKRLTLLLLLMH